MCSLKYRYVEKKDQHSRFISTIYFSTAHNHLNVKDKGVQIGMRLFTTHPYDSGVQLRSPSCVELKKLDIFTL